MPSAFADTPGGDSNYYYAVVAVNSLGFCASSVVGPVQSYLTPSGPRADVGLPGQSDSAGRYPVVVSNFRVDAGRATLYRVALANGDSATTSGDAVTLYPSGQDFGNSLAVTVSACRLANNGGQYCTDDTAVGNAVPLNTRATAVAPTAGGKIALNPPQNAGSPTVTYSIRICTGAIGEGAFGCADGDANGKYAEGSTIPADATKITVQATVAGRTDSNPTEQDVAPAPAAPPAG
ncbi:MAG: hypothetical protein AAGC90_02335 [Curtobacterium sp.]